MGLIAFETIEIWIRANYEDLLVSDEIVYFCEPKDFPQRTLSAKTDEEFNLKINGAWDRLIIEHFGCGYIIISENIDNAHQVLIYHPTIGLRQGVKYQSKLAGDPIELARQSLLRISAALKKQD